MFDKLLEWDREIFVYLNGLGVDSTDTFWMVATEIVSWTPLFILFIVLILLEYPERGGVYRSLSVLALLLFVLMLTHFTKEFFERLRPNNEEQLQEVIRVLKEPGSFSFFSGHAATSFSITTLIFLFLRGRISGIWLFYLWPFIFSLSRIYVGVHYPFDILTGAVIGVALGFITHKMYNQFIGPYSDSTRL